VADLAALEYDRSLKYPRGNAQEELEALAARHSVEMEMHHLDLYRIFKVYEKAMQRFQTQETKPKHTVEQFAYTIEGQKQELFRILAQHGSWAFTQIIEMAQDKIAALFSFLAILDLLQLQKIKLIAGEGFNNFRIISVPDSTSE
jgi:segregation and condensation protein A